LTALMSMLFCMFLCRVLLFLHHQFFLTSVRTHGVFWS